MIIPKCEIRLMRYFLAVCETLNFRRAAENLNIAQPALSRAIRQLEDILETSLLDRNNRNVQLTEAGKKFRMGCLRTLSSAEQAIVDTWNVRDGEVGHIAIGYTDFAISGDLPELVSAFRLKYPQISITLRDYCTGLQLEALDRGTIHIGMVTGPIHSSGLGQTMLQKNKMVVVLHEDHALARLKKIPLKKLADLPFVTGRKEQWSHYLSHMESVCRQAGFQPNIVQEADEANGLFGLIAADMGITVYVDTVQNCIRRGTAVRMLAGPDVWVPTVAVWKAETLPLAGEHFIEFLRDWQVNGPQHER